MVVCRYFNQGYCRYGDHCRFEHISSPNNRYVVNNNRSGDRYPPVYTAPSSNYGYQQSPNRSYVSPTFGQSSPTDKEIQQSVCQDIDDWITGKLWPFSVYAPLKEGENFPTFEDISPEELRFDAYTLKCQGNTDNYSLKVNELEKEIQKKRLALKKPSKEIMDVLRKIFRRERLNTPSSNDVFQSPVPKGILQTNTPVGTFQFKLPDAGNTSEQRNLFGGQNVYPSVSPSGSFSSGNSTLFAGNGYQPASTSSSLFGQSSFAHSSNQQPTTGMFGSPVTSNTPDGSKFSFRMESHPSVFANNPAGDTSFSKSVNPMDFSFSSSDANNNVFKKNPNFSLGLSISSGDNLQDLNYTPISDLTTEEKEQFEAPMFTLGKIPEHAPPKELC